MRRVPERERGKWLELALEKQTGWERIQEPVFCTGHESPKTVNEMNVILPGKYKPLWVGIASQRGLGRVVQQQIWADQTSVAQVWILFHVWQATVEWFDPGAGSPSNRLMVHFGYCLLDKRRMSGEARDTYCSMGEGAWLLCRTPAICPPAPLSNLSEPASASETDWHFFNPELPASSPVHTVES